MSTCKVWVWYSYLDYLPKPSPSASQSNAHTSAIPRGPQPHWSVLCSETERHFLGPYAAILFSGRWLLDLTFASSMSTSLLLWLMALSTRAEFPTEMVRRSNQITNLEAGPLDGRGHCEESSDAVRVARDSRLGK